MFVSAEMLYFYVSKCVETNSCKFVMFIDKKCHNALHVGLGPSLAQDWHQMHHRVLVFHHQMALLSDILLVHTW